MAQNVLQIKAGSLWPTIQRRTQAALRSGKLFPIATEQEFVEDGGVRFLVRVVSSLSRKDAEREKHNTATRRVQTKSNPFLPYEQELFVSDISDTHIALLNKFNVIDHHLLIVTCDFVDQEALLSERDFEALWACLMEYESLGFYNGGTVAGASQSHKHLQLVPLPLADRGPAVPIDPLLDAARCNGVFGVLPELPFVHSFTRLDPSRIERLSDAVQLVYERYRAMLKAVGLEAIQRGGGFVQSGPYNLLVTRRWMLLVPRSRELFDGISINALGFAGSLFVRNTEQLQSIKQRGPMRILKHVSIARN